MFDTVNTTVQSGPSFKEVHKTVHEHRAPTDKSVELLNEFQEKAKANIISHIHLDDNTIKGAVVTFQDHLIEDNVIVFLKFSLNGKERTIERKIAKRDMWKSEVRFNGNRIPGELMDAYVHVVAGELFKMTIKPDIMKMFH